MADPTLDSIMAQYLGSGGTAASAAPAGSGAASQQYWPGTSTTKTANKTYSVYLGRTPDGYDVNESEPIKGKDKTMTESQAVASFHTWDADQLSKWKQLLISKGVLDPRKATYATLQKEWTTAVQNAAQAYTIGGQEVTPYDMVDLMATVNGTNGAGGLASGALVPGTTRQSETDRVVDHVSDTEASKILDSAFEQAVGRAPTDTEREEFANRLHTAIQNNPTVTKITASMDPQGNITRNETSTGGFGSGGVTGYASATALDDAKQDPEYGAFQASTTYFNALLSAIKSPT